MGPIESPASGSWFTSTRSASWWKVAINACKRCCTPTKGWRARRREVGTRRMSRSVLRADRVSKRLGGREILREVSIEVHSGEVVGLLGPNGAGKTTTFYTIVGLIRPDSGRV